MQNTPGRIVEKYKTQTAFANAIGMTKYAFSRKMTGKTALSQPDIVLPLTNTQRLFF